MLFVNPEINIPETNVITVNPNSNEVSEDLGPNKNYVFKAGIDYDWEKIMSSRFTTTPTFTSKKALTFEPGLSKRKGK